MDPNAGEDGSVEFLKLARMFEDKVFLDAHDHVSLLSYTPSVVSQSSMILTISFEELNLHHITL